MTDTTTLRNPSPLSYRVASIYLLAVMNDDVNLTINY